jgi:hypothetical protein
LRKGKKIHENLFQRVWRQGLAGYYTTFISQLFPGEQLGSFFARIEDWSKRGDYSSWGKPQGSEANDEVTKLN